MLVNIATIVGAIVTIVSFFVALYKFAKKIDSIVHSIDENTMYTLKLVILNKDLTIEERIHAGDRYNHLGVIVEEVNEIFPELTVNNEDGIL